MSKKIFVACFALSVGFLFLAFAALGIWGYAVYAEHGDALTVGGFFTAMIGPAVILSAVGVLLAVLLSARIAAALVRPIRRLDLTHPAETKTYPELAPILAYIDEQNREARTRMGELLRRRTEFDTLTAHMSEGMIILNDRAEILSCNRAARSLFSLADSAVPKNVLSLRSTDGFREAVRLALSGKNGYDLWQSGETYYSLLATPVLHEGGVEGAVLMFLDVTEKEERERLRREFTANISHELKTPLTSISGFAELIAGGVADGEDARRFAANIHREAGRLITLVGDIIRLSQLDGGEFDFERDPLDLRTLSLEVTDRLASVAAARQITLSVEGGPLFIRGNYQIVSQMIYNLVENGIRYNREGGYVRICLQETQGVLNLTVVDNGIGIPKEAQPRIFERFFRVDKSHSKEVGGTGLGLSIVKHAAARHGAKVSLVSEEGKGTSVTLSFPKAAT